LYSGLLDIRGGSNKTDLERQSVKAANSTRPAKNKEIHPIIENRVACVKQ